MNLTHSFVRKLLKYDPKTGLFYWLVSLSNRVKRGSIAGYTSKRGYVKIRCNNKIYLAHRLALFWMTGKWPKNEIDHINHNTSDNRWINLRKATRNENTRNQRKRRDNTSGIKNVYWIKTMKKWGAAIMVNKKIIYLGSHVSKQEMAERYRIAAQKYHGQFASLE